MLTVEFDSVVVALAAPETEVMTGPEAQVLPIIGQVQLSAAAITPRTVKPPADASEMWGRFFERDLQIN